MNSIQSKLLELERKVNDLISFKDKLLSKINSLENTIKEKDSLINSKGIEIKNLREVVYEYENDKFVHEGSDDVLEGYDKKIVTLIEEIDSCLKIIEG